MNEANLVFNLFCRIFKGFQDFINAGANFPSVYFVEQCQAVLNSELKKKTNTLGSYYDPKQKIEYFFRLFKDHIVMRDNTINIRLAGDGTQIGKNYSVLNFSFGFLDDITNEARMNPNTVTGNLCLGLFKIITEDYDSIKTALKEILESLATFDSMNIDGVDYKIEFWLGGDLKFLALVLGKCSSQFSFAILIFLKKFLFIFRNKCSICRSSLHLVFI